MKLIDSCGFVISTYIIEYKVLVCVLTSSDNVQESMHSLTFLVSADKCYAAVYSEY